MRCVTYWDGQEVVTTTAAVEVAEVGPVNSQWWRRQAATRPVMEMGVYENAQATRRSSRMRTDSCTSGESSFRVKRHAEAFKINPHRSRVKAMAACQLDSLLTGLLTTLYCHVVVLVPLGSLLFELDRFVASWQLFSCEKHGLPKSDRMTQWVTAAQWVTPAGWQRAVLGLEILSAPISSEHLSIFYTSAICQIRFLRIVSSFNLRSLHKKLKVD